MQFYTNFDLNGFFFSNFSLGHSKHLCVIKPFGHSRPNCFFQATYKKGSIFVYLLISKHISTKKIN